MITLLLQPHSDDCCLFACFTAIRYQPHIVTVLRSQVQEDRGTGITDAVRQQEDACAFQILGVTHESFDTDDRMPDWEYVETMLRTMDAHETYERVFAPAVEPDGHAQHSMVGEIADRVFGDRVTHYLTYTNGRERNADGRGVAVAYEDAWMPIKLRAMACYTSQIGEPSTTHHFFFLPAFYEWYEE